MAANPYASIPADDTANPYASIPDDPAPAPDLLGDSARIIRPSAAISGGAKVSVPDHLSTGIEMADLAAPFTHPGIFDPENGIPYLTDKLPKPTSTVGKLSVGGAQGLEELGRGVGDFFTSGSGLVQIGAAATPLAPVVYGKWAYDMAKAGYQSAQQAVDDFKKSDWQKFGKDTVGAFGAFLGAKAAAGHGLGHLKATAESFVPMGTGEAARPQIEGAQNASNIPSAEIIPQPEIRPQVGKEAPLRQPGETPAAPPLSGAPDAPVIEPKPVEAPKVEPKKADSQIRLELDTEHSAGTITPERNALREKYIAEQKARDMAAMSKQYAELKAAKAAADKISGRPIQEWSQQVKDSGFKDQTEWSYRFAEENPTITAESLDALKKKANADSLATIKPGAGAIDGGMKGQFFSEAAKWRRALDEAKKLENPTIEQLAKIESDLGVGGMDKGKELQRALERTSAKADELKNAPETITGSNGGKAPEMPAEVGASPTPEQSNPLPKVHPDISKLTRDRFQNKYFIHFDVRPGAESRIGENVSKGFNSGMVSTDIDNFTPESALAKNSMARGWGRAYGADKPGSIAYLFTSKDFNGDSLRLKPGAKPSGVVRLTKEGQSVWDAIQEQKNTPEKVVEKTAPTETPEQSAAPLKSSVERFLEPLAPMQKGKTKKSLDKEVVNGGKVYKISELVGNRVSKGAKIEVSTRVDETARRKLQAEYDRTRGNYPIGNQLHPETIRFNKIREELKAGGPRVEVRELTNPDGSFLSEKNIGKTAMDYAEHLIKDRDKISTEKPSEPVAPPAAEKPPVAGAEPGAAEHTGLGGAVPSEFRNNPQTPTGIKNATVDVERSKRGLPQAIAPAKRAFGKVWDEAMAIVDRDPGFQDDLIAELRMQPRALTDIEDALLLHRQIDLQNEYGKATRDLAQAFDDGRPDGIAEARDRVARWSDKLQELYDVGKKSGTETGRGLNARKMMAYEDFSLANMELQKRSVNDGKPLTDDQRAEITKLHEKIADLQKRLDEATAKADQQAKVQPTTEAVDKAVKKADTEAAQEKSKGEQRDFAAEQKEATDFLKESYGENGNFSESTSAIKKLMELFARAGIRERLPMEDAIHRVLKEIQPDITREQAQDLMSGYGKSRLPSQDVAKKTVRDINAQILSVRKLLDYFQNKRPKLTGQLRDVPSQIQRDLLKMVNEAKKNFKLDGVTDNAKAVKSALDAVNTRLKNRLADLKQEVITRRKIINERSPSPYNEETLRLRKEIEEVKKLHDEIFGTEMSDARRIQLAERATERQISELERQLKTGEIFPKSPVERNLHSEKLDALKARLDELKSTRDFARDSAQPKMEPEAAFLLNYELRLRRRASEYRDRLAKGDFETRVRRPTPTSPEILKAKAAVEAAKLEFRRGLNRDLQSKRTPFEKAADTFVKWRRAFILSGPITLAKLTSAAVQRMGISTLEEGIGTGISKVIPRVAAKAPREGGASVKVEAKAITEGFVKGMSDAWQILKTGQSELDLNYGKARLEDRSAIEFIGSIHGALKAQTKRNEFTRSLEKRMQHALENGVDVHDPMVQSRLALDAYKDAERSIFMQDNRVIDAYKRALSRFSQVDKQTGKVPMTSKLATATANTLLPIVKIPTNIVAETFQYALGSVTGSARLANAFRKGVENLSPGQADLIMRDLKKGSLGAAVLLLGYFSADSVGGYYQIGQKRDPKDVGYGKIRLFGMDIPSYLTHNPLLEVLQLGATVRRVADSRLKKSDENPQGLGTGIAAGALGLVEEVPFVREMMESSKAFNPRERGAFFGELGKSVLVPQLLQTIANWKDKNAAGETIKRDPQTIMEHIKTGIPGLRETVKEKGAKKPQYSWPYNK